MKIRALGIVALAFFALAGILVSHSHAAPHWRERRTFVARLQNEMRQFDNTLKTEMNELKASQKARRDQSEREARDQRRECFKQATRGSEKRACVQALLARRKELTQQMKQEMAQKRDDQRQRRKLQEEDQRRRLADFDRGAGVAATETAATAPVATPTP